MPSNGGPRPRGEISIEARELGQALARLRQKLPEAADAIELIARRVAVLERQGDHDVEFSPAEMVKGSNISGCGIAFYSSRELAAGRTLDLELHLDSGAVRLQATGRVISSESLAPREQGWLVRVDFSDMEPGDEETLVQYVMRRQLRQMRRARDAADARAER